MTADWARSAAVLGPRRPARKDPKLGVPADRGPAVLQMTPVYGPGAWPRGPLPAISGDEAAGWYPVREWASLTGMTA